MWGLAAGFLSIVALMVFNYEFAEAYALSTQILLLWYVVGFVVEICVFCNSRRKSEIHKLLLDRRIFIGIVSYSALFVAGPILLIKSGVAVTIFGFLTILSALCIKIAFANEINRKIIKVNQAINRYR
jgi:glucan phosphoethanolaminetransferase (alkaline phosphatase superfamily)